MRKIRLLLEVQNRLGQNIKVFKKEVESEYTPHKDMVFGGDDYTLTARSIYFDLDDGSIFVRFVEIPSEDEINGWDFLLKEGWDEL